MERIVFLKSEGQYGVFSFWIEEMRQALEEQNIESFVVDLNDHELVREQLNEAFQQPALCYVGINAQGCEFESEPFSAFKKVKRPYIGLCIDHPVWHHERLIEADPYLFYTFIDPVHVEYAEIVYPEAKPAFFPHAGSFSKLDRDPASERPYDLIFLGSYHDPEETRKKWSPEFAKIADECLELLSIDGLLDYHHVAQRLLESRCMNVTAPLLRQMHHLIRELDLYLRDTTRKKVVDFLGESGISIDLFGNGWEEYRNSSHRVHEPVPYEQALDLMAKSRCVLNVNPNFPLGLHERMLSTMLNGAVAITDHKQTIDEALIPDQSFLAYSDRSLEELPSKINRILSDDDARIAMAKHGQERAAAAHTWKHRVQSLIALAELFRAIV